MPFHDRHHAALKLADVLMEYKGSSPVVYALPRGGVELGALVAKKLLAPLDLLIPRKIAHPMMSEYAIASVSETGDVIKNASEVVSVDSDWFEGEVKKQRDEAKRRRETYMSGRDPIDVENKVAIVVDDGIATGLTMKAAIDELKKKKPSKIVVAIPVAPRETIKELETLVDQVIVLERPDFFAGSIGAYYDTFDQVEDHQVIQIMDTL